VRIGRIRRDKSGVRVEASGRRMLLLAIFVALVAVGMGAATVAEDSWWTRAFYGAVTLFVAGLAVSGFWQSRKRTIPVISVRDEGIVHAKVGLIPWDEIDDVGPYSSFGNSMVGIWTVDPYFPARKAKTWWMWPFVILNAMFRAPAISVPGSIAPVDELLAEIDERRARASR
jgi:hypothetical protein